MGRHMQTDLETLATRAAGGDRDALESLASEVQDFVYRLALRFLGDPDDAADATQEIMTKVITHLGDFGGRSKLTTWVYTIASRHLINTGRGRVESTVAGPEQFADWLDRNVGEPAAGYDDAEYRLLCGEVRMACTYGMLLTLTRDVRIAYLLGDLVGMTDTAGGEALGISPADFRQRLARARLTMRAIIAGRCGLVDRGHRCA